MGWRRVDVPGHELTTFERDADGWRIAGELDVHEDGCAARLRYVITCDVGWRTRTASVEGLADGRPFAVSITADAAGHWACDGAPLPALDGALDVDLGFTPATNTLPIRRLDLAVGTARRVRTAWLRFPELRLERLEQSYARIDELAYRYEADVDGAPFTARLDTTADGRVLRYEGLWEAERVEPAA